jgi:excisionase family DNA binding protein
VKPPNLLRPLTDVAEQERLWCVEKLLTTTEAADLLGFSASTVRRMVDRGELASILTPGGHRRISKRDVETIRNQLRAESEPRNPDEMHLR